MFLSAICQTFLPLFINVSIAVIVLAITQNHLNPVDLSTFIDVPFSDLSDIDLEEMVGMYRLL